MDRFKAKLQHDVRLVRRDFRNHLISETQIESFREQLEDSSANARWLNEEGLPCAEEAEQVLLRYHNEGWSELISGEGLDAEPIATKVAVEEIVENTTEDTVEG